MLPDGSSALTPLKCYQTCGLTKCGWRNYISIALHTPKVSICKWHTETVSEVNADDTRDVKVPKPLIATWIIGGILGWFAAFSLVIERIHVAANANALASCDLNPILSCKSVMLSEQASLFGFPNPIIGLFAFFAPIFVAAAVLAGGKFKTWFWQIFMAGLTGGFIFVLWLATQTIYSINAICLYCIVAWIGMIPMFWSTLFWLIHEDIIQAPVRFTNLFDAAHKRSWIFTVVTELVIATAILTHFWDRIGLMLSITR